MHGLSWLRWFRRDKTHIRANFAVVSLSAPNGLRLPPVAFKVIISAGAGSTDFLLDDVSLIVDEEITAPVCPVNQVNSENLPEVLMGDDVSLPLSGSDVDTWTITYNSQTAILPGKRDTYTLEGLTGNATAVAITANGYDSDREGVGAL